MLSNFALQRRDKILPFRKLRRTLLALSVLLMALNFLLLHPKNVLAANPNDCSVAAITLCNYDAPNYTPRPSNSMYDKPVLQMNGSYIKANTTPTIPGGSTIDLTVGYNSLYGSGGQSVFTWVNISANGNPGSNFLNGINAAGGISSTDKCFNEVVSQWSPYHNTLWNQTPGGTFLCDQPHFTFPPPTTANPTGTPPPGPSENYSTVGIGASAVWYKSSGSIMETPRYSLQLFTKNVSSPQTFCLRTHVSISNYNASSSGYNAQDWDGLGKRGLPDDKGVFGAGIGDTNSQCFTIVPSSGGGGGPGGGTDELPYADRAVDCNYMYIHNLFDPNDDGRGVFWEAVLYDGQGTGTVRAYYNGYNGNGANVTIPIDQGFDYNGADDGWTAKLIIHNFPVGGAPSDPGTTPYEVIVYSPQPCRTATCNLTASTPGLPANSVIAGKPFTVTATMYSHGNSDLPQYVGGRELSFSPGGGADNAKFGFITPKTLGQGVPLGGSGSTTFTLTAPNNVGAYVLDAYPDYYGNYALMASPGDPTVQHCQVTVSTYQRFTFSLNATLNPNDEQDPTLATYTTSLKNNAGVPVGGGPPGPPTPAPTTSEFFLVKAGGGARTYLDGPVGNFGPWQPGVTTYTLNTSKAISGPFTVGDKYCSAIDTNSYNQGYVGPSGVVVGQSNNNTDDVTGGPLPNSAATCFMVTNKPVFKVYGGSVSAGGDLSCSAGSSGVLASWNNDSGANPVGAGAELRALLVKGDITGFASTQYDNTRNPAGLSFANTGVGVNVTSGSSTSPKYGGNFGGSHCLTVATPPKSATAHSGTSKVNLQPLNGAHTYDRSINLKLPPGQNIPTGKKITIYVTGDVYIENNIGYDTAGWTYVPGDPASSNIPSFTLIATGNIYIDPGVTQLDGWYTSQKSGGSIYTCSQDTGGGIFKPVTADQLFAVCSKQLLVNGIFEAENVKLMRSYGSLRNEKAPGNCSNNGGTASVVASTCAAEIFRNDPLFYISSPLVMPPSNGALRYDAITSLPPVL